MKRAGDRRRQVFEPLLPCLHDLDRLRDRLGPRDRKFGNHGDRAGSEIEIRDDAKTSVAAAAQRPKQLRIFLFARNQDLSRRIDHLHRQDAVACEAKGAPKQPKAAAQRVARDPYREAAAGWNRQMA
jgi:hypothetical protein